jgi:pimeloyl-ACP methyl ester carboxylesterase
VVAYGPGIHVEESGSGDPLVLVHGLGGSTRIWRRVQPLLAERFHVIAYDLRGLGRSGPPPDPCTMDELVADLDAVVEAAAGGSASVLGHSLGAAVALAYAADHREQVRAVVAVSAPSLTPGEQAAAVRLRARRALEEGMEAIADLHAAVGLPEEFRAAHPGEGDAYRSVLAAGSAEGYAALCGVIADLDLTGALGRIDAPVLLVQGELDQVVPAVAARATADAIAGSEYVQLEGCGHVVPVERPDELAALAAAFVAERG